MTTRPTCTGVQMLNHPAGVLTCPTRIAEDATQTRDHLEPRSA